MGMFSVGPVVVGCVGHCIDFDDFGYFALLEIVVWVVNCILISYVFRLAW
jgi:hypothetical protein